MITHPAFPIEPWSVRETRLDLDVLAQAESVFALANGHIGLRANLDEGEPVALPGTYLNSFYELRPLPYAEAGYGYPESGQTVVNVTDGKIIRLLVDDEPFDVRYGDGALARAGARPARRRPAAPRPSGSRRPTRRSRSPRRGSSRSRTARRPRSCTRSTALDDAGPGRGAVGAARERAHRDGREGPARRRRSRVAAVSEFFGHDERRLVMVHSTRASKLRMAAAADHEFDAPGRVAEHVTARRTSAGSTSPPRSSPGSACGS